MASIYSGLRFLPILWSLLLVTTVIISRLIVDTRDINDSVPNTSTFQWTRSIHSQLLDSLALVGLLSVVIRYLHLELVTKGRLQEETYGRIGRLRLASLSFGVGTMLGITVISNFRQSGGLDYKTLESLHHIGRMLVGLCGITYCSLQTIITFDLAKLEISTIKLFVLRVVISSLLCVSGFVHVAMEVWLATRFLKDDEPYTDTYSVPDAVSDVSKWLTFLLFATFSLTYFPEFRGLGVEMKCFLKDKYNKTKQESTIGNHPTLNLQETDLESSEED